MTSGRSRPGGRPGTASYVAEPFLEILYRTALNSRDQARAGARQTITLLPVDGQAGEPDGIPQHLARLRRVTLRISYNDGSTWQVVPVRRRGGRWVAMITNPTRPGARFASLRVTAQDAGGAPLTRPSSTPTRSGTEVRADPAHPVA